MDSMECRVGWRACPERLAKSREHHGHRHTYHFSPFRSAHQLACYSVQSLRGSLGSRRLRSSHSTAGLTGANRVRASQRHFSLSLACLVQVLGTRLLVGRLANCPLIHRVVIASAAGIRRATHLGETHRQESWSDAGTIPPSHEPNLCVFRFAINSALPMPERRATRIR